MVVNPRCECGATVTATVKRRHLGSDIPVPVNSFLLYKIMGENGDDDDDEQND